MTQFEISSYKHCKDPDTIHPKMVSCPNRPQGVIIMFGAIDFQYESKTIKNVSSNVSALIIRIRKFQISSLSSNADWDSSAPYSKTDNWNFGCEKLMFVTETHFPISHVNLTRLAFATCGISYFFGPINHIGETLSTSE